MATAVTKASADGGVLVWTVADATVDGGDTGTSFRRALGFMERRLRLRKTINPVQLTGPTSNMAPPPDEGNPHPFRTLVGRRGDQDFPRRQVLFHNPATCYYLLNNLNLGVHDDGSKHERDRP